MNNLRLWNEEEEDARCKYLHGQPKKMTVEQKFRLILRLLRRDFPPDLPVKVRRVNKVIMGSDEPHGICWLSNANKPLSQRYYSIRINKGDSWTQQFDTLLHEWAHCLTWHLINKETHHGDSFHRKYGVLYRHYIED